MSLSSKVEVNLPGNRNENSYKPKLLIESQFLLNSNTPFKLQEIYFFLVVIEIVCNLKECIYCRMKKIIFWNSKAQF